MLTYTLAHVSDATLLADLAALVAADRQTTAALLAHLGEVEARGLYLPAACSSMHVYCTRVLHLAEEVAYKRIRAARVARRFPPIFDAIADGRLHLSGVVMLAPHLTDHNVEELVAAAAHRSKAEIEMLLARLAPRPDLPAAITLVAPPSEPSGVFQLDPDPVAAPPAPAPPRVKPIAPERFALQVTIGQATRDKLERAQALLRHRNPSGDLAEVLDRALDALLDRLEREKFGATSRPRARKARTADGDPRHVPNDVKRTVHERDGEQCTFVSDTGERCTERGFLELDHRTPVARGGKATVDEIRVLCRAHNQYEAERILGSDLMRARREDAKTTRGDAIEARPFEPDLTLALRGLGFTAAETRLAVANTSQLSVTTFEQRLRAALAELTRSRGFRCSDGPFDLVTSRTTALVSCA